MRTFLFSSTASSSIAALFSVAAFGQTAQAPAHGVEDEFVLADVHVRAHNPNQYMRGGVLRGDRYELLTATMLNLIHEAYGVDYEKTLGGPGGREANSLRRDRQGAARHAAGNTQADAAGAAGGPFQTGGP